MSSFLLFVVRTLSIITGEWLKYPLSATYRPASETVACYLDDRLHRSAGASTGVSISTRLTFVRQPIDRSWPVDCCSSRGDVYRFSLTANITHDLQETKIMLKSWRL